MLPAASSYDDLRRSFRWQIPARYNIAVDVCDKWASDPDRLALIYWRGDGEVERHSFQQLQRQSKRLANLLAAHGLRAGDRVGILLPQAPETAFAHLAAYRMAAIAVPLFTLFGAEALEFRLSNSGAAAVITDRSGAEKIAAIRDRLPALRLVASVDGAGEQAHDLHQELARASDSFETADTGPDDPALIIYTSGTTGPPKGALHAHRVLLGHLPGVEMPHEFFPQPGDLFWTPADWAWIGGLIDVLLPAWHHGVPVLACRFAKFDPEQAFELLAAFGVRNSFMPPTALKLMRQVARPQQRWAYQVRSIGSGGESLGDELLDWGRETFGITINEFYGQTECNLVVANCAGLMPLRPGAMGRAVPGHEVAVLDSGGQPLGQGETGAIAVRSPDPVMFLEYWQNRQATEAKFIGDWLVTGDQGRLDEAGYIHFVGRDDDVITSAGYRIGPGEIEDCLLQHPAVAMAAVIGVPDPIRTQRVKAFLILKPGHQPGEPLTRDIQNHVRHRLAAHEYPREISYVDELPMTATGKVMRGVLRQGPAGT